jgi:hypothetical protein
MSYGSPTHAREGAKIKFAIGARVTLCGGHPSAGSSGEYIGTRQLFKAALPIPQVRIDTLPGRKGRIVFVLRPDYWKPE